MGLRALLIGCGNIGAQYDMLSEHIWTHAKAYSKTRDIDAFVYDIDVEKARNVADHYKFELVHEVEQLNFGTFDVISICSPTQTHFTLLRKALLERTPKIICEKPVSLLKEEVLELENLYKESQSLVYVNYIRRFQPAFIQLRQLISTILENEKLNAISITYQRGFINNCSHAFDLIEFLTGGEIALSDVRKSRLVYDSFAYDPTLSFTANWNETQVMVSGLTEIDYSQFQIDLYFKTYKITISESGNTVKTFRKSTKNNGLEELVSHCYDGAIQNYMQFVLNAVIEQGPDNFLAATGLNVKMLNYLAV